MQTSVALATTPLLLKKILDQFRQARPIGSTPMVVARSSEYARRSTGFCA
jgi:hypothetical protein